LAIADVAAIMVHGVITRAGHPSELTDEVSAAYLGARA
jgi:ABC-type branched-subunit amino acid transport system ATPase component